MFSIIHQVIIIILDVSQCETDTCSGNGECVHDTDGMPFCKCDDGWKTTNCNTSINDCKENFCLYDGTCVDGHLGFTCICPPYRTGYRCSEGKITGIIVDFLSLNHVIVLFLCCKNPVLIEYFTNYLRTDVAECESDTCHHGQRVEKRYGGTVCKCDTGYMGEDCSININECAAQPCLNGGECNDLVNGRTCDCPSAYKGDTCNIGKLVRYN